MQKIDSPIYLIKDYMKTSVPTISVEAVLQDAVAVMIKEKTNGLVVVDQNKHIQGIVTVWDIIERIVPDYLEEDKHLASFESGDILAVRTRAVSHHPIKELMKDKIHTVNENDPVMKAATMVSEYRLRQIPVVNQAGILAGVISRTQVKQVIAKILGIEA